MAHHPLFILLSLGVAVLGSWTALDLLRRVAGNFGRARLGWLAAASLVMGLSIWSMHFVAMLGFDPGSAVAYDPWLTALSLLLAIGSTAGAFFFASAETVSTPRVVAAGIVMGGGICLMHYTGMAALRTAVSLGYDGRLVAASFLLSVIASIGALFAARRQHSLGSQALAATMLGFAVVGMHYTAMAALRLTPAADAPASAATPPYALAVAVAAATALILFVALMAALHDERGNLQAALAAGGVGYWELDLRSFTLHISDTGKAIFGLGAADDLTFEKALERIAPESREQRARAMAEAIRSGTDYDVEYPLAEAGRWVNARGRTLKARSGRPRRMVGVVIDVTERHQAMTRIIESEQRQRLLIDELNHRVKNTLATVQSISRQTAKRAESPAAFNRDFEARLLALSSTHNALTRGGWEGASLREIVDGELRPYAQSQVSLSGEDVVLKAREALALGMVVHELATNAAKHGALSLAAGRLSLSWRCEAFQESRALVLDWVEEGRPILQAPTARGFGSRLIHASIEQELGGVLHLDYAPSGLKARLLVPLAGARPQAMAAVA
ncbi:hypothetical protein ASG48_10320 [Aurantimonas sp. Leaf443]|nr:hypothetical protein ASG48_10320 [Aurantimonas sp. Leaf443]